ncbi:phosphatase PAP2 family protein [Comamonas sp. CMM03]|uniref:phosphatase PAP2 family protein n=1 Tax=Comamonas sp. CMM03 TaxID=2854781 RepID=UPI001C46D0D7|nr:phosphatase PAP2 family protein [Comamonas sp. CMM03]MBV7418761.1 phosphatase PAP2 family protein [Comamonas sp. CMM03]
MQLSLPPPDRSLDTPSDLHAPSYPTRHYLIASWLLGAALLCLAAIAGNPGVEAHELASLKLLRSLGSETLRWLMLAMYQFQIPVLAAVTAAGLALPLRRRQWRLVAESAVLLLGAMPLDLVLKAAFHRARPAVDQLVPAHGYSFPSGHTMSAAVIVGWALCMILRSSLRRSTRMAMACAVVMIVVLVALSRVYLGAHYPSDVVASCIAAACWISLCLAYFETLRPRSLAT